MTAAMPASRTRQAAGPREYRSKQAGAVAEAGEPDGVSQPHAGGELPRWSPYVEAAEPSKNAHVGARGAATVLGVRRHSAGRPTNSRSRCGTSLAVLLSMA
jgi:hypothetical protein